MHSKAAVSAYPNGGLLATTADLREAYDRGAREATENARTTLSEDKAYIEKLEARLAPPGGHDHEFEDCCAICGLTWHEAHQ